MSEPMPPEDQARGDALSQTIAGDVAALMRGEAKRRGLAAVVSVTSLLGLLAFFLVRARAVLGERLVPVVAACGVLVGGVAAAAALKMRKWTPMVLGLALLIAVGFTAFVAGHGWYPMNGLECAAVEGLFAGVTVAPAAMMMRKNGDPVDPWRVMTWTALGGSIGAACLWIACPARDALEHSLAFHLGAVVLAIGLMRTWALRAAR